MLTEAENYLRKFIKKFRPSAVAENVAEARKRQSAESLPGIDNAASDDQGAVISHPSLMKDPSMIVRRVAADADSEEQGECGGTQCKNMRIATIRFWHGATENAP